MKFKISHTLIDTLEDRSNLHASIPKIRAALWHLIGEENFNERSIRLHLLVHECFSMVGIPKRQEGSAELDLKQTIREVFKQDDSNDPFTHTRFEINQSSIEFQDEILAKEVLESKDTHQDTEEKYIDYPVEIDDRV